MNDFVCIVAVAVWHYKNNNEITLHGENKTPYRVSNGLCYCFMKIIEFEENNQVRDSFANKTIVKCFAQ